MRDKLGYLISMLDFCIGEGMEPEEAWSETLRAYAFVYHNNDGRPRISRASQRVLEITGEWGTKEIEHSPL
jgi:hypothetical protein